MLGAPTLLAAMITHHTLSNKRFRISAIHWPSTHHVVPPLAFASLVRSSTVGQGHQRRFHPCLEAFHHRDGPASHLPDIRCYAWRTTLFP